MATPESRARKAGTQYADDQVASDHFRDWYLDQLLDGEKLSRRGEAAAGFETWNLVHKANALTLAKRMLQQLRWDIGRGVEENEFARYVEAAGGDVPPRGPHYEQARRSFFDGVRARLESTPMRSWLAGEIQDWAKDRSVRSRASGDMKLGVSGRRSYGDSSPFKEIADPDSAYEYVNRLGFAGGGGNIATKQQDLTVVVDALLEASGNTTWYHKVFKPFRVQFKTHVAPSGHKFPWLGKFTVKAVDGTTRTVDMRTVKRK